jgi:hypothetical protein
MTITPMKSSPLSPPILSSASRFTAGWRVQSPTFPGKFGLGLVQRRAGAVRRVRAAIKAAVARRHSP